VLPTLDSSYAKERPELTCKLDSIVDNYSDEPASDDVYDDGTAAYERGAYTAALLFWTEAARRGAASAQHNLGMMYEKGKGVPQDYAEAASGIG
jgi:TPR repeat protein